MAYLTLPNFLSLLRLPLALFFLKQSTLVRAIALFLAIISDGLDGFFARRRQQASQFGALLDPCTDRLFVSFAVAVFIYEGKIELPAVCALFCRDLSVFLFGLSLVFRGKLSRYRFRAIWSGKATTCLQFACLLTLTLGWEVPSSLYTLFVVLGISALGELTILSRHPSAFRASSG